MIKTIKNSLIIIVSALVGGSAVYLFMVYQSDYAKMYRAIDMIETQYIEQTSRGQLIDGAIEGMLQSLDDPYTSYMDQEEAQQFYENIHSSFEGIGATLEEVDGKIVIVSPLKGSPAEEAGLKPGDIIVKIGEIELDGMKLHEAIPLIRGAKGTIALITVYREDIAAELQFSIVRDTIPINTVYSEISDNHVGVIRIASFAESTAQEFEIAVNELLNQGMKGVVIDVRQNPGGLTDSVEAIASMILKEGSVITQFESRNEPLRIMKSNFKDVGIHSLPIAVLIDGGSASAAEILAGALQQAGGFKLIGQKTFGKGTAQINVPFPDQSSMKYTVARWLTPNGTSIDKAGLNPDFEVALPDYAEVKPLDPKVTWKQEQYSNEIRSAQIILRALGFDPNREDGFFDSKTREKLQQFQQTHQLPDSGVLEGETTRKLMTEIRNLIIASDTQQIAAIQWILEQL
jgi:carboxyl-terminal processing protease